MTIDDKDPKHLIADEGMVLRRTIGFPIMGKEIYLGKVLVDDLLIDDRVEYYEEIPEPEPEPMNEEEPVNEEVKEDTENGEDKVHE